MRKLSILAFSSALLASTAAFAVDFRIGLAEDPDVLDPARARTFVGRIVFASLCDKLVDLTPELKIVPQLATEWSWSADGKTLTMKLRTDAKFHDGAAFDAAAAKANLDRAMTMPDSIRKSELASVAGVDVVDATTLTIRLKAPDATLLAQLSDRAGMMLSPATFGSDPGQKPICSGPYKFAERVQNDRIVLEKFADYRDAANYKFDRVIFLPIPDTTVRLANLRSGQLDMLERLAPSDVPAVKSDKNLTFAPVTGLGYQGITINLNNGARSKTPLGQDKRVRQALELAIDRNVINEVIGAGIYPPAQQPFPSASPYHSAKYPLRPRDVAKAKALLKEAGQEHPKFELSTATGNINQQTAELIQAMAKEVGFEVTIRATEFAALQKDLAAGNYDAVQIGWSGRVDPDGNIDAFVNCKGGLNDAKFCSADVDLLLSEARLVPDQQKRLEFYDQAQAILQQELPIIYLYYQPWPFVVAKKVQGYTPYPDGLIRLKGVSYAQ